MSRSHFRQLLFFLFFLLLLSAVALVFSFVAFHYAAQSVSDDSHPATAPSFTVVLDAGHGGEDGGASSTSGILEKDVNLTVTMLIKEILEANGVNVVMTRTDDRLLYDKNADYQGRKKALDLLARRTVAENTADSIFVSIHLNSYPSEKYHGLQVWYSPNHEHSRELAAAMEE